ncbi:hypothetical protein MRB53_005513 [Persea americana]|uniref:Uncharacterized protein n=1 Tax=Persea americana TaxID=3435 RepID=A0ACC2MDJ3_PERAE|nr:hypothetical protein MRB53_005513 [Persea americana]
MSRGQSQPRMQSGKRTLLRHKDKGKFDNVVVIDVDQCESSNVVTIDAQECSQWRQMGFGASKENKERPPRVIISIDDEECDGNDDHRNGDEGGDLDSDATSSKRVHPTLVQSHLSPKEADGADCEIFEETNFASKLSKRMRMCPGNGRPSLNHFGLYDESESSSSESDSSDCELMEDSSGKIREQWEKAAFKKTVRNSRFSFDDQVSAFGSSSDPRDLSQVTTQENVDKEDSAQANVDKEDSAGGTNCFSVEHYENAPICSNSSKGSNERDNLSTCNTTYKPGGKGPFADLDHMADHISHEKAGFKGKDDEVLEEPSMGKTQLQNNGDFDQVGVSSRNKDKPMSGEDSFHDTRLQDGTCVHHSRTGSQDKEPVSNKMPDEVGVSFGRAGFQDKEESVSEKPSCCNTQSQHEAQVNHDRASFRDKMESYPEDATLDNAHPEGGTWASNERTVFEDKEELVSVVSPRSKTHLQHRAQIDHDHAKMMVSGEAHLGSGQPWDETQLIDDTTGLQSEAKVILQEPCLFSTEQQEEGETPGISSMDSRNTDGVAYEESSTDGVPNNLIGEREKLKETDEFKRALEEELASRKLQLQIQAEEAQRLRKRRKAETMRLLDMERRQRQRLEEVRETQKKDEETINLKEKFRAEIREELENIELRYRDMASLLRALGVPVGGGLYPTPREINAAYKQALLRFHPDRASRSDVRQQVEAEEIFKLISRLKEKLL